jgi:DNA-directed RNA polymerase subunit RPC12/RpoP
MKEENQHEHMLNEQEERNPLKIYCASCASPAEFDIVKQSYHCAYCNSDTNINVSLEKMKQWRTQQQSALKLENLAGVVNCECPSCGARVAVDAGEATETCGFCSSKVVRRDFVTQDAFPEVIIPFFLTQEEAVKQLSLWAERNHRKQEAKDVLDHLNGLAGYYLPYQLVKGPVYGQVSREKTNRKYDCEGFLDGIAVNASRQLDNLVLVGYMNLRQKVSVVIV